jgi:hypothetical protein
VENGGERGRWSKTLGWMGHNQAVFFFVLLVLAQSQCQRERQRRDGCVMFFAQVLRKHLLLLFLLWFASSLGYL